MNHTSYMQQALALARHNLGQAWPNPAVGAVVVKDGAVIGEGWTGRGGRPHAETEALNMAGVNARSATLYITLEPCAHHGKTPPCTDAIIAAGIKTCVIACRDPHANVNGKGITQLQAVGIEVIENICAEEAKKSHEGFFSLVKKNRPFVALKIATSADEKIAYPSPGADAPPSPSRGEGIRWITSEPAREYGQRLRSEYDAILTGMGTVLADDPLLTCRIPGLKDKSPVRVILDRKHRLPVDSKIAKTRDTVPTWVLDLPDIPAVLTHLANQGITRVLVETGQGLNTAFLESGLVDRVYWFKAPITVGKSGLSAISGQKNTLSALAHGRPVEHIVLPPDTLDILELCSPAS
jgi:diaminohydroxyphosphoribosylaminopyrimidine deaminase/5-amino-6-(5-phosphoribosylamino)uracil reductase